MVFLTVHYIVLYNVLNMINTISITDLKQNTSRVIKQIQDHGESVLILQHSKAAAVLVDPDYFNTLEEALENRMDLKAIEERKSEPTVPFEEVAKKLGL